MMNDNFISMLYLRKYNTHSEADRVIPDRPAVRLIQEDLSIEYKEYAPSNQILYTAPQKVTTISSACNVNMIPELTIWDPYTKKGVITFDGDITSIRGIEDATESGSGAFSTSNINSVILPRSLTTIGGYTFTNVKAQSIELQDKVTSIGKKSFLNCVNLESLNLPEGVTSIGDDAFDNDGNLEYINLPSTLTSYGILPFNNCGKLNCTISLLRSTYKSTLFGTYLAGTIEGPQTISILSVADDTFTGDYNVKVLFMTGTSKGTITYNVYVDNQIVHDQIIAINDQYTIFNLYHLDGTPWSE